MNIPKIFLCAAIAVSIALVPVSLTAQTTDSTYPTLNIAVTDESTVEESCAETDTDSTEMQRALNKPLTIGVKDSCIKADGGILATRILGITVPFIFAIAVLWLILHFRNARERERLRVLEASLRSDRIMPDGFYRCLNNKPIENKLQTGICWIGAGLAIILFFLNVATEVAPVGVLPLFIGLAQVIVYRVQSRKNRYNNPFDDNRHDDAQQD